MEVNDFLTMLEEDDFVLELGEGGGGGGGASSPALTTRPINMSLERSEEWGRVISSGNYGGDGAFCVTTNVGHFRKL